MLADEINRAPPKTQAALLQAMQEHAVTAAGQTHRLPEPFFVLATQNPIEQEGTYPLPEAQLDRFMMQLTVGYPTREEEERIVAATTGDLEVDIKPMLNAEQLLALQHLVRRLPAPPSVVSYAVRLARSTRPGAEEATPLGEEVRELGRRPARVAVPHPRRQGARGDGRARRAGFRGCECDGGAGAQPPRRREFPGGGGRHVAGAARHGAGASVAPSLFGLKVHNSARRSPGRRGAPLTFSSRSRIRNLVLITLRRACNSPVPRWYRGFLGLVFDAILIRQLLPIKQYAAAFPRRNHRSWAERRILATRSACRRGPKRGVQISTPLSRQTVSILCDWIGDCWPAY